MNVAVLGAGAWGTALAIQAAKKAPVTLWARDSGHIQECKRQEQILNIWATLNFQSP